MEWNDRFMTLFRDAVERFHLRPQTPADRLFLPEELEFLVSIGYTAEEMHAYIREYATQGEPSVSTALLIAATRRSFFLTQQRGISAAAAVRAKDLPPESEAFQEIVYLPHLILKATHKLHGTLDPTLLYGNEQDRRFLAEHGQIHPADFLFITWMARGDKQKIVQHVINATQAAAAHAEEISHEPAEAPAKEPAAADEGTESEENTAR